MTAYTGILKTACSARPYLYEQTCRTTFFLEYIERIDSYTEQNRELFLNDRKTYDAVIRNLQTMAESTQKLPQETKDKHPNIKWNQISGFRNILVHDYLGDINKEQIWNIIEKYLPELQAAMRAELPDWKDLLKF